MPDISITQAHAMSLATARAAAQKVADRMAQDYEISSEWDGDVLSFRRSGVNGTLAVGAHDARLDITLGFMLKGFAGAIQEKVAHNMQKVFGATS